MCKKLMKDYSNCVCVCVKDMMMRQEADKSYNNEPMKVFPVRTAKQTALSTDLCWCNNGSKIRCSITPATTWYLLNTIPIYPYIYLD